VAVAATDLLDIPIVVFQLRIPVIAADNVGIVVG
jgi:hypothetical protein